MAQGILRWDRQDLVIPLTISVAHWRRGDDYVEEAASRIQPIIQARLEETAREGWQADEPTDFATLFSRSQVCTRDGLFHWRIDSVTIRQVRPVRSRSIPA
jgi:hypothetical protein